MMTMAYQNFVRRARNPLVLGLVALVLTVGCSQTSTNTPTASPAQSPALSAALASTQQRYGLSVTIIPSGSGIVAVSPSGGAIVPGTKVTLIAAPLDGWSFDHWDGDASSASATVTVIVDSNKEVVAYFESTVSLSVPSISPAEARSILDTVPNVMFVDVRPKTDYDKQHIPRAISIPFTEFKDRYAEITVGPQVIVYAECH